MPEKYRQYSSWIYSPSISAIHRGRWLQIGGVWNTLTPPFKGSSSISSPLPVNTAEHRLLIYQPHFTAQMCRQLYIYILFVEVKGNFSSRVCHERFCGLWERSGWFLCPSVWIVSVVLDSSCWGVEFLSEEWRLKNKIPWKKIPFGQWTSGVIWKSFHLITLWLIKTRLILTLSCNTLGVDIVCTFFSR